MQYSFVRKVSFEWSNLCYIIDNFWNALKMDQKFLVKNDRFISSVNSFLWQLLTIHSYLFKTFSRFRLLSSVSCQFGNIIQYSNHFVRYCSLLNHFLFCVLVSLRIFLLIALLSKKWLWSYSLFRYKLSYCISSFLFFFLNAPHTKILFRFNVYG